MAKRRAGILLFRRGADGTEVLLGHSGGPYNEHRDVNAWSVPKGEYGDDETAFEAAQREFTEELGLTWPEGEPTPLCDTVQRSGNVVTLWAI